MKDVFGRSINYLRISVIDNCNLRCIYCHDGVYEKLPVESIISYEEILKIVRFLKVRGLKGVRITGGEPLIRKDLAFLVKNLTALRLDVSLTTNGVFLAQKAQELYDAGLGRINIGLDSLDKALFQRITGYDGLEKVIEGINTALRIGFDPIKINVVLIKGINEDIYSWLDFIKDRPVTVRFVEVMPFVNGFKPVNNAEIKEKISKKACLQKISLPGRGPAKHYSIFGYKGNIGFISPETESFCANCSRLRLNAQGQIRACLFDSNMFDYLSLIRNGFSEEKLDLLVNKVLVHKPKDKTELKPSQNMCVIGG